jgi:hypothetical protein
MLDDNYDGDEYTDWRFHDGGQEWFKAAAAADGAYEGAAVDHLREEYQKAVKDADVLTIDIGMNNFGVYVSERTFNYLQGEEPSFGADLDPAAKEAHLSELEAMRDEIIALVGMDIFSIGDPLVEYLVKTIQYAYVGFVDNFDASLGHIYEMNPDINVVVVGMYNTMDDIQLEYMDGVILPAGDMIDIILKYANDHMMKNSEFANRYIFVDSANRHNFYHQLTVDGKTYATLSDECRRVIYEYALPFAQSAIAENPILELLGTEADLADFIANMMAQIFAKALSNPVLDKDSLGNMDIDGFKAAVVDSITDAVTNGYAKGEANYVPKMEFLDEEPYSTIGFFWCRFFFEDWFFIHPDEQGHSEAAAQIMKAYENKYTGNEQPEEPKDTFTDVEKGRFYYDAVYWAVDKGITNGITATTFEPETACTRAQAVTFLYRLAGKPSVAGVENPFTDLDPKAFYYDAVLWAVNAGITNGMTATTFEPQTTCTRGQIVTFIWRASGKEAANATTHPFTDVKEGAYYYDAMLWAVENGITNGMTDTTFAPANECTRGQIVTFLYRGFAE